jgi:hypothetical protein
MSSPLIAARRGGAALVIVAIASAVLLMLGNIANATIVATVPLATSANYSVLGGQAVTNTGNSTLGQSLGLSPDTASSITGFPPGIVGGTTDSGPTGVPLQAQTDLTAAYNNAAGRPVDATEPADLGGLTLQGGVYDSTSHGALGVTGTLTLDGAGDPSTVFIFQSGSTLITAPNSTVQLINGAQECNVFWQVTSSATLDTDSTFVGNILALTSITVNHNVTVHGRALARNGSVTLDDDTFTSPLCATSSPVTTTTTAGGGATPGAGGGTGGSSSDVTTGSGTPGTGTGTGTGTPGAPGTPSVVAPPRTGGGPLPGATFPWPGVLFVGALATAGTVAVVRNRRAQQRHLTPVQH